MRENTASPSGSGGIANRGSLTLTRSTVADNFGDSDAGGIWNSGSGTLVLIESAITGNSTNGPGGGIFNLPGGALEVTGGTIADNTATTVGGGIFTLGTATLATSSFAGTRPEAPAAASPTAAAAWASSPARSATMLPRAGVAALRTTAGP